MATTVRCSCGQQVRMGGSRAACPACGQTVVVAGVTASPNAGRPAAPSRATESGRTPASPPVKSGSSGIWIVVLVLVIPLLLASLCGLGAVGVGYMFFVSRSSAPMTAATAGPPMAMKPVAGPGFPMQPRPIEPVNFQPNPMPNTTFDPAPPTRLTVQASSTWGQYLPDNLVDGKLETTWFSGTGDSVAKGQSPWAEVGLPADRAIQRVQVLGNRDPAWPQGYAVLAGRLTLYDKDRKVLKTMDAEATGTMRDFDFRIPGGIQNVRFIRFTSTRDEGHINGSGDVALSEIIFE